jgi:hypothetical protein
VKAKTSLLALLLATISACGDQVKPVDPDAAPVAPAWLESAHIIVPGYGQTNMDCRTGICAHNENNDMIVFDGALYMIHRTALSQALGPNSSLRISRSDDHGATWVLQSVIPAIDGRDLRDPSFYLVDGKLAVKALTRLPVTSARDSNVKTISVGAVSPDAGKSWSALTAIGPTEWSFWRIRDHAGVHYNAAYEDGDKSVRLFSSTDGTTWTKGALIWGDAADTPLETEIAFMPSGRMLALVRMDGLDNELLGSAGRLRTKVCWANAPYDTFTCPQDLNGVRMDGHNLFFYQGRLFVLARKHFLETDNRKRMTLYEITGNLEGGPIAYKDHGDFPSAGDTSYAGIALADETDQAMDPPWLSAMFGPTDIWQVTINLAKL